MTAPIQDLGPPPDLQDLGPPPSATDRMVAATQHRANGPLSLSQQLRSLEQGATFGFGDKINAALRSLVTSQTFSGALQDERAKNAAAQQQDPGGYRVGNLFGGALPLLAGPVGRAAGLLAPATAAAGDLTMGRQMLSAAKMGMGYGALAGAGNADFDPSGSVPDALGSMTSGAVKGGVVGGLLGGALPPALRGAGSVAGKVAGPVGDWLASAQPGLSVKALSPTDAMAARIFGDAAPSAQRRATSLVLKDLERGKVSLPDAVDQVTGDPSRPLTLADIGPTTGPRPLNPLAQAVNSIPGTAQQDLPAFYAQRSLDRGRRLASDMTAVSKVPAVQMPQHADQILNNANEAADQMYSAARQESPRIQIGDSVAKILMDPAIQKALKGVGTANRLGATIGTRTEMESPFVTNRELHAPNGLAGTTLPPDAIQHAMANDGDLTGWLDRTNVRPDMDPASYDAMVSRIGEVGAQASKKGNNNLANVLFQVKGRLQDQLGQQAPLFAEARQAFGTAQARARAAQAGASLGKSLGGMTPDEITAAMAEHPEGLDDFRAGATASMRQKILDGGYRDLLDPRRALGKDQRLTALFGPDAAAALRENLQAEQAMHQTEQGVLGGSRTAPLAQKMGEVTDQPGLDMVDHMVNGGLNPASVVKRGIKSMIGDHLSQTARGLNSATAGATGNLLLQGQGGPKQLLDALDFLTTARQRVAQQAATKARIAGLLGNFSQEQ